LITLPNLPNGLTLGRIFLVPILVVVLLTRTERWELIGAAIFAATPKMRPAAAADTPVSMRRSASMSP